MLESISHQRQGMGEGATELNRRALADADIVISPELGRTKADLHEMGWKRDDVMLAYNVGVAERIAPVQKRIPRVLHAGSIGRQTLVNRLLSDDLSHIGFDLAGPAETDEARSLLNELVARPNIRYLGMLPHEKIIEMRKEYAYSLAIWEPTNINQIFASPNKFFETIACGTPPIAGPHPQCADLIARHSCGLTMMSWEQESFNWTVSKAMSLFKQAFPEVDFDDDERWSASATQASPVFKNPDPSSAYGQMVANCFKVAESELNWAVQVAPILARIEVELKRLNLVG
jgi:glycosyltransferase involved in cell wall biosynthesis